LSFWNQPNFNKGELSDDSNICSVCYLKVNNRSPKIARNLKAYAKDEVFELIASKRKPAIKNNQDKMNKEKKLFISHSSKDSLYVEQLIDIIENIGVPSDNIFCSSFEGYGIQLGEDFLARLKKELNNNVLVVFVLSNNFYSSPISLCEMGATWMQTSEHLPILIPPFDFENVKGVIPSTQGMKINDKNKLNSFKEKLEDFFSIESRSFSI